MLEKRLAEAGLDSAATTALVDILGTSDLAALRDRVGRAPALAEHFDRLDRYLAHLAALGIADWARFDLSIVRGLAYYTGIVFELFDVQGQFRAISGGGRYDTLLHSLGKVDLPALGFGMGDVVLAELLRDRGLMPSTAATVDFWVAGEDEQLLGEVMRVATALRQRGRSVEYALRPQSMSRQLKTAASAGARQVVLLQRAPLAAGNATVKSLANGAETAVRIEEWLAGA